MLRCQWSRRDSPGARQRRQSAEADLSAVGSAPGEDFVEAPAASLEIRVLAAEDNSINQLVLKTLLHQIGIDPMVVDNGARAVEAWEAQAFDIILMDLAMPKMDGVAATRVLKSDASTRRPPSNS